MFELLILSILAGIFIGIGGLVNLIIGGIAGAVVFAVGLLTIIRFDLALFTGKAGLLFNSVKPKELICIWIGNFIGAGLMATIPQYSNGATFNAARSIIEARTAMPLELDLIMGIVCGLLMYVAVTKSDKDLYVILCVAAFIFVGGQHCVADMFYLTSGYESIYDYISLLPTTFGNLLGCCMIPFCRWCLQSKEEMG